MEKKQFKSILLAITYAIVLFFVLMNLKQIGGVFQTGFSVLQPFILGGCLAFVLSIPMRFFERTIFSFHKHPKLKKMKRTFSLLTTFCVFVGVIIAVIFIVIPELVVTFQKIGASVPGFLQELNRITEQMATDLQGLGSLVQSTDFNFNSMIEQAISVLQNSVVTAVNSMIGVVTSVAQGVFNVVVGVIFSAYVLFAKEKLAKQSKKLLYAFVKEPIADRLMSIGVLSHQTFSKFLTGQCVEALILGAMFFIAMSIFQIPYALLISVVISVAALIPVFGAFIGCVVGMLLIVMVDPMQAVWFLVLFLVLQQVEGNLIYPHVVGGSVGLPAIWVLIAVTLGGSLFGIFGMLLFIPLVSVLYTLLGQLIDSRLLKKRVKPAKWIQKQIK